MRQSLRIIEFCLYSMPVGEVSSKESIVYNVDKKEAQTSMELTISRFKYYSENVSFPNNLTYTSI
jgi:NADH:ubiquinone oxidoreductase subunit D